MCEYVIWERCSSIEGDGKGVRLVVLRQQLLLYHHQTHAIRRHTSTLEVFLNVHHELTIY